MTAAILVGGQARRLGGIVKPDLRIGDQRILDRQLRALHEGGIERVVLIGRWPADAVPGVQHVADAVEDAGALGGLYSALLVGTAPIVLVLAGDLPFLTARWLQRVADVGEAEASVPRTHERWHPLCAAYRRTVAARVKRQIDRGRLRITDALATLDVRAIDGDEIAQFDTTGMLLMNVNTPDDYREAERLARSHS